MFNNLFRNLNGLIIIPVILLVLIGVLAIWSVSDDAASDNSPSRQMNPLQKIWGIQVIKQLFFLVLALIVFWILLAVNYYRLKDYSYLIYGLCLGLLGILVVWGKLSPGGARRWFSLGPLAFQPSEVTKIALVLALSRLMMYQSRLARLRDFIPPLALTLLPMVLVLLQPNLGTALVMFPTFIVMLIASGTPRRNLVMLFLAILVLAPLSYFVVLKDYQRQRIRTFFNPTSAPTREGFQLIQSRVAVGSGGLIGRQWGQAESTATLFVPERHNDFIFTTISEGWGFVGSSLVILLYLVLFAGALLTAYNIREPFGRLVIIGLVGYLATQTFINIAMTIGLAPITGITLPFISYGGSSLLASFISLALIINIGAQQIPSFSGRDFA
jgi:rod shape determining protein RodA